MKFKHSKRASLGTDRALLKTLIVFWIIVFAKGSKAESLCITKLAAVTAAAVPSPAIQVLAVSVSRILKEGIPQRDRATANQRLLFEFQNFVKKFGFSSELWPAQKAKVESRLAGLTLVERYAYEKFFSILNKISETGPISAWEMQNLKTELQNLLKGLVPRRDQGGAITFGVTSGVVMGSLCTYLGGKVPFEDSIYRDLHLFVAGMGCLTLGGSKAYVTRITRKPFLLTTTTHQIWKSIEKYNHLTNSLSDLDVTHSLVARLYGEYRISAQTILHMNNLVPRFGTQGFIESFTALPELSRDILEIWQLFDYSETALWTLVKGYLDTPSVKQLDSEVSKLLGNKILQEIRKISSRDIPFSFLD